MAKYEYRNAWFYSGLQREVVERKGLLGGSSHENIFQDLPDFGHLAEELTASIAKLENDGYDVHTVLPIQVGSVRSEVSGQTGDVAFSLTRGAVIVGRRLASTEGQV